MSYVHLARSSFNDEEMFQMLASSPPFGEHTLRKHFRRTRGLFLSKHLKEQGLAEIYARLGFSWRQFEDLASYLDNAEMGDKRSSVKLKCALSNEVLEEAIKSIKETRTSEQYLPTITPSSWELKATYVKTDFSKSKSRQREKKTVGISIKVTEEETEIEYDSDDRGAVIVDQLVREIRKASTTTVPSECEINFSGKAREQNQTDFLLALTKDFGGYKRISVCDVKVNRVTANDPKGDEDISEEKRDEIKGFIRSAVLHGDDVTSSKFFQQLMTDGYYLSGISWFAREVGGATRKVELEAGFKDDELKSRFFVDAKRFFEKNENQDDEATGKRFTPFHRAALQRKVIAAAYKIYEEKSIEDDE